MSLLRFFQQTCLKVNVETLNVWHTNVSVILSRRHHSTLNISGIFPPIPTPFENDHSVSYTKLKKNFDIWKHIPFSGYVVQGSNGEYPLLAAEERVEVVKKVKEIMPKNKLLIAGSGCESTMATIEMSNAMANCGADAVLVVTPSFFKNQMLSPALTKHYLTVADECKVPVILYNVPSNTGINIPVEAVAHLSKHPNICGIKDSGGDISRIGLIVHKTKDSQGFQVLAGSAGFLLASHMVGAVGGVCALANVLGQEVCTLSQLYEDGDMKRATELQHRLIAPNSAITASFGVPGLKAAMPWFGLDGGVPRPPLQILDDESKAIVRKAFEDNGFL